MTERLISVSAVARRLDLSVETVRRWVKSGKIAGVKYPSGQYRVFASEVEKILGHSATDATPPTSNPV